MVNDNGLVNYCASRQRAHIRQMMEKEGKKKEPEEGKVHWSKAHPLKCIAVRIDSFIILIWLHHRSACITQSELNPRNFA